MKQASSCASCIAACKCNRFTASRLTPQPAAQVFLTKRHLAIVTEYADQGDLADCLAGKRVLSTPEDSRGLPLPQCRAIFQQLALAIDHCHSRCCRKALCAL